MPQPRPGSSLHHRISPVVASSRYNLPFEEAKTSPPSSVTLTKSEPFKAVLHNVSPVSRSTASTVPLIPITTMFKRNAMPVPPSFHSHSQSSSLDRGASPLGRPYTRPRSPLRRLASAYARSATARPRQSLGGGGPVGWLARPLARRAAVGAGRLWRYVLVKWTDFRCLRVLYQIHRAPDQRREHHQETKSMGARSNRPIEAHPAERGQQILPVMSLHLSAGPAAEEHQLQRAGIGDVRCEIEEVFSCPPCADDRAEGVALFEEGYRERQRQSKLEQASAQDVHEPAERNKQDVSSLVEDQVRQMKDGFGRRNTHRCASKWPCPDPQACKQCGADQPHRIAKWVTA